jgi:hypothetical protein
MYWNLEGVATAERRLPVVWQQPATRSSNLLLVADKKPLSTVAARRMQVDLKHLEAWFEGLSDI